jgi:signal transduction histidine kinase
MRQSRETESRRIADLQRRREREAADSARAVARKHGRGKDTALAAERARADDALQTERRLADSALEAERIDADERLESAATHLAQETAGRAAALETVATREQLLAVVSHDLKNPLNTILLGLAAIGADSAGRAGDPRDATRAVLARMYRAARLMDRMIADLLDSERLAAGLLVLRPVHQDVAEVVREVLEGARPAAELASVALTADVPEEPVSADYDPQRIAQVLANLVDNAIKHTPSGGTISIGYRQEGAATRLWVSDTGPGVPAPQRDAIFERFSQLGRGDRRSIGLGLFICRRIVEAHGGRIWVEDGPDGRGARFEIRLPRRAQAA